MIKLSEKSEDGTDMLSADFGNKSAYVAQEPRRATVWNAMQWQRKMSQVTRGSSQLFQVNAGTVA
jgi:hypothetical protein